MHVYLPVLFSLTARLWPLGQTIGISVAFIAWALTLRGGMVVVVARMMVMMMVMMKTYDYQDLASGQQMELFESTKNI
jgi:hypothetical protein